MAANDEEFLIELGAAIVKRRKKLNLSQADLAYRVGMEVPSLSNIENGKTNSHILTLARIASALTIDLSLLLPSVGSHGGFLDKQGKYIPPRSKRKG